MVQRSLACLAFLCVALVTGTAASQPARIPTLLVARPIVNTNDTAASEIIYNAILAGLQDSIARGTRDSRLFVRVVTDTVFKQELATAEPVVLFASYSRQKVEGLLEKRVKEASTLLLASILSIQISEVTPKNLEVSLALYDPNSWTIIGAERRIGGCGESLDELAHQARDRAAGLNTKGLSATSPPKPVLRIAGEAVADTYQFLVGTDIVLDSCATTDAAGEAFDVTWKAPDLLPAASHRRQLKLALNEARTYKIDLVTARSNKSESVPATVTVTVLPKPHAEIAIERCLEEGKTCTEADANRSDSESKVAKSAIDTTQGFESGAQSGVVQHPPRPLPRPPQAPEPEAPVSTARTRMVQLTSDGKTDLRLRALFPNRERTPSREACAPTPSQITVQWIQLAGPQVAQQRQRSCGVLDIPLDASKSGYYDFKLVVTSGRWTDEARVSFLAAPPIHADAGAHIVKVKRGYRVELDGSGSFDVVGEELSYVWVLERDRPYEECLAAKRATRAARNDTECRPTARLFNTHASRAEFVADEASEYVVRLYVRAARRIDDARPVEIATDQVTIRVSSNSNKLAFVGGRLPGRAFIAPGGAVDYGRYVFSVGSKTRAFVGGELGFALDDAREPFLIIGPRVGVESLLGPRFVMGLGLVALYQSKRSDGSSTTCGATADSTTARRSAC